MDNLIRGADFPGKRLDGREGVKLGSVRELYIDPSSGQSRFLIVEAPSLLGNSGKYHPVPWEAVRYDPVAGSFQLPMTKDQFKAAPSYDRDQLASPSSGWVEMAARHFAGTMAAD
jgi:sporulation protein YlmC with PRC-barrel domain